MFWLKIFCHMIVKNHFNKKGSIFINKRSGAVLYLMRTLCTVDVCSIMSSM